MTEKFLGAETFKRTGLTPTVGLGFPRFVIHGTYRHPLTGANTPLPAHHFAAVQAAGPEDVIVGTNTAESGA